MALAFTSLGVTEDRLVNCRGGWVFHVQGESSHLIGLLQSNEGVDRLAICLQHAIGISPKNELKPQALSEYNEFPTNDALTTSPLFK